MTETKKVQVTSQQVSLLKKAHKRYEATRRGAFEQYNLVASAIIASTVDITKVIGIKVHDDHIEVMIDGEDNSSDDPATDG